MFIDADVRSSGSDCSFITDDKIFLDSYYEECWDKIEKNEIYRAKPNKKARDLRKELSYCGPRIEEEVFWFKLKCSFSDLFIALLYKKAEEFQYELKAATDGGYGDYGRHLIFMKPFAGAK